MNKYTHKSRIKSQQTSKQTVQLLGRSHSRSGCTLPSRCVSSGIVTLENTRRKLTEAKADSTPFLFNLPHTNRSEFLSRNIQGASFRDPPHYQQNRFCDLVMLIMRLDDRWRHNTLQQFNVII